MATLLKGMRITHISLVKNPANHEQVIWKSKESVPSGYEVLSIASTELKKSDEKHMVYGLVYCPDVVDAHGEYSNAAEIAKAAYGFMKDLRGGNVDVQHDFNPKDAFVAESWLIKGTDPLFEHAPDGSWAVGIHIEDAALWESVKKGELKGLSMAGFAQRVKKQEEGSGLLKNVEEFFGGLAGLLKGSAETKAEAAKKDETPPVNPEAELKKYNEAMGVLLSLPEWMEKTNERLEAMEKSAPGLKAGGVDGAASSKDGLEGIL